MHVSMGMQALSQRCERVSTSGDVGEPVVCSFTQARRHPGGRAQPEKTVS